MAKSAKVPSVPPTVLVITLDANGTGSLLTRRGDLAHLSQFSYTGLTEIVAAMQAGAVALADLEKNPPQVNAAPSILTASELPVSTEESLPDADEEQASEPEPVEDEPLIPDATSIEVSESDSPTAQTRLF